MERVLNTDKENYFMHLTSMRVKLPKYFNVDQLKMREIEMTPFPHLIDISKYDKYTRNMDHQDHVR